MEQLTIPGTDPAGRVDAHLYLHAEGGAHGVVEAVTPSGKSLWLVSLPYRQHPERALEDLVLGLREAFFSVAGPF